MVRLRSTGRAVSGAVLQAGWERDEGQIAKIVYNAVTDTARACDQAAYAP